MTLTLGRVYQNGHLEHEFSSFEETHSYLREHGGLAWIWLDRPREPELYAAAGELGLHPLAVTAAMRGTRRPRLERYGDTLLVVLRAASYDDGQHRIEFDEIYAMAGPALFVVVHDPDAAAGLAASAARQLDDDPELTALGTGAMLYALVDAAIEAYAPVVSGLEQEIDQMEEQLFAGTPASSRRIYDLFTDVVELQRAVRPLGDMLDTLLQGTDAADIPTELRRRFQHVQHKVSRLVDRTDSFRALLQNALTVDATIVARKQNDDTKKISAWAAILFTPTLVGSIYGMNFRHMPELHWVWGYPASLALMLLVGVSVYASFKHRGWI